MSSRGIAPAPPSPTCAGSRSGGRSWALLVAPWLLAASACTRIQPPLTPPEAGGAPWRELVSGHVILRTDRAEDDARETLVDLEQTYGALRDIAFPQLDVSGSRIVVLHFARQRDFEALAKANIAGQFYPRLPNDLVPEPTMVVWGKVDATARTTLRHELTHMFARVSLGPMPTWFNEGLAQYYETLEIEDGFAYVGRPQLTARAWARSEWNVFRNGPFLTTHVPIGYVPEVAKLTAMDTGQFYVWSDKGRQPTEDEVKRLTAHYLGAAGLVHLLLQDPKYQPRFDALMEAIGKSEPFSEAWSAAVAGVDAAAMETDFRQHLLNRFETMVLRTPYKLPDVKTESERALTPAEVHLIWARLRPFKGPDLAAAKADVDAAKALSPQSPDVLAVAARLALAMDKLSDAAAAVDEALSARPKDERLLILAAVIGGSRVDAASAESKPALALKRDKLLERLASAATTGLAFAMLANHAASAEKWDEAKAFAQRGIKSDPTSADGFAALARVAFQQQDHEGAVRAMQIALSLLPDGTRVEELETRYRKYLEAAEKARR